MQTAEEDARSVAIGVSAATGPILVGPAEADVVFGSNGGAHRDGWAARAVIAVGDVRRQELPLGVIGAPLVAIVPPRQNAAFGSSGNRGGVA